MRRVIIYLLASFFISLFIVTPLFTDNQTVFGPKTIRINQWHFYLSYYQFNVDDPEDGLLLITKNTTDKRFSGGFLFFNGKYIDIYSFLTGNDTFFEKDISLLSLNRLFIFLWGSPGASITLEVKKKGPIPPPEVTFTAHPDTINPGDSTLLEWTTTNADNVHIDQGIGSVPPSGSLEVYPTETVTYTLTAEGPGGITTSSVTVTVQLPPPTVSITASPASIEPGGSSVLSWTSTNAQSIHIDRGIGSVSPDGSVTVSPEHTTTYTITVSGPTGSANAQAMVKVMGNPEPQPEGTFGEQYAQLIPEDATVDEYDPRRFSVVTGLVHSIEGSPIADVLVTAHNRPEYGTVATNAEGRFSLPLEGGGTITIVYQKEGLIPSQRKVYVPWNDIAIVDTVQMIEEDSSSTKIVFDGNPETVMTHQSSEVVDDFGKRSCTMVLSGDTKAYLVDENGNDVHELTAVNARATEFFTPDSMPAILPPTSAYTYCVELGVDGAQRVRFDRPVVTWVDNFMGFDVGGIVPVGYYDRDRGIWVPSDNGVVVRLLDTDADSIVDALDADGDGEPNDLDSDGSFNDEVKGLSDPASYPSGSTFWRVEVSHFTPYDLNWPIGRGPGSFLPDLEPDIDQQREDDCVDYVGSLVETRSRVFHEDIPIPGTDITLHYTASRVKGHKVDITVPASGGTIPSILKHIVVQVNVAGKSMEQVLDPLPNQRAEFTWDGLDYLSNSVLHPTRAYINIGYVFEGNYWTATVSPQSFALAGVEPTNVSTREDVNLWDLKQKTIYRPPKGADVIADGWSVSGHHSISLKDTSTLFKGGGSMAKNNVSIIETAAGNPEGGGYGGFSGDGGSAVEATLNSPRRVAVDPEGNLYIADTSNHRIRKVDTDGIIDTVAGNGTSEFFGDGGPAIEAGLNEPYAIAVDSAGNLYIADSYNHRIRRVDTGGVISTVAGNGESGFSGDDGPAIEAALSSPLGVAVDPEGNLYIADTGNHCIRKVSPGGIINTIAGTGNQGFFGDEGLATEAELDTPRGIAVDSAGNLSIADSYNHRIRRVDTGGIISTVAGNGNPGFSGDNGPAIEAELSEPQDIAIDSEDNLYIADTYNSRIRVVDQSGVINTIAGNGDAWFGGDGGPATAASIGWPEGVALDAAKSLYIAERERHVIRKAAVPSAFSEAMSVGEFAFSEGSSLGHIMSASGRHKKSIDVDSGITLRQFDYDQDNSLVSITDRFGDETKIQRNANGIPISIVSPDGLTTTLTIDGNNHLTRITYPDGSFYGFEYSPEGLLTAKIEPEGSRFEYQFGSSGKLAAATDEESGHRNYERAINEDGDIITRITTAEGNVTSYRDRTYSTGEYTSTITEPTGAEVLFTRSADGLSVNKRLPCGMEFDLSYDVDSRSKTKYAKEIKETTLLGLEKITQRTRTYEDTDSDNSPDLITDTIEVNGKPTTLENNILLSQKSIFSSEGRSVASLYDPETLLIKNVMVPGLIDATYQYDPRGRLTSVKTGDREATFTYDTRGFLESVTDPENITTTYTYDPVGRITSVNRPDGYSVGFTYDRNGNMIVLTTPSGIDHVFGFNRININDAYTTPISGSYRYVYDRDRRLKQVNLPSGKQINNIYDNIRLKQIQTPESSIDLTYYCSTMLKSIGDGTNTITYDYDGSLITSETLSGTLNQTLSYTYNNDFDLESFGYAGGVTNLVYDDDSLLTGAGDFTISRNADNGMPEGVSGGSLNLSHAFNGYGELSEEDFTVSGQSLAKWDLGRDKNGRITSKNQTVAGETSGYVYTYDPMGRLRTVTRDGYFIEEYRYGPNGTRTYEMNLPRGITGRSLTYSDEDHLLMAGTSTTYQYDSDGFLTNKFEGSDVTTYDYSTRGELMSIMLPDGRFIEYVSDPAGRRVAKKINGSIVEKYLWQGLTRLLAVYDGNENLIMRFEYADARMPVAMTQSGTTYYLAYDQVGSLVLVSDASGSVVKKIGYDSFGNVIEDTNPAFEVPFGFAGSLYDRDTGLIRFGYRDYDPDVGRWTAKDPILFAGGDTDLYGYCLNDPINSIDLDGLSSDSPCPCKTPRWLCVKKCIDFLSNVATFIPPTEEGILYVTLPFLGGMSIGCTIICSIDPCSYDEVLANWKTTNIEDFFYLDMEIKLSLLKMGINKYNQIIYDIYRYYAWYSSPQFIMRLQRLSG